MGLAAKFKEMLNITILFSIGIGLVIVMLMSLAALVESQNEEQDFVINIDTNGQLLHLLVYQSMRDNTGVSDGHPLDHRDGPGGRLDRVVRIRSRCR